jgi:hypothetical protein
MAGHKVIQGQHTVIRHLRRVRLQLLLAEFYYILPFADQCLTFFHFFPTHIVAQHKDCSFDCQEQRTVRGMLRSILGQNDLF